MEGIPGQPLMIVVGLLCWGLSLALFRAARHTAPSHWRRTLMVFVCASLFYGGLHVLVYFYRDSSTAMLWILTCKILILALITLTLVFSLPRLIEIGNNEHFLKRTEALKKTEDALLESQERMEAAVKTSKRAEHSLRISEERYRSLVSATSSVVWTSSSRGAFNAPQPSWEHYTGQKWPEYRGWGWMKMVHRDDVRMVKQQLRQSFQNPRQFRFVGRLWNEQFQAYRFVEARAVPIKTTSNRLREWVGSLIDIHETRMAREEERKFKFLSDNANDTCFLINRQAELVYVNKAASKLLGYSNLELLHAPLHRIVQKYDPKKFENFFERPSETHFAPFESAYLHKNGDVIPVEVSLSKLEYDGDYYLSAIIRDISERKAVEESLKNHAEELSRSNQELERIAYISSHDMKEPLRMVNLYVQMLEKHLAGKLDSRGTDFLTHIIEGARRMFSLIQDLSLYSQMGKKLGPFRELPADAAVQSAILNLQSALDEAGGEVRVAPLPIVNGNSDQLTQLFQNLVANAIKFRSASPPKIEIQAQLQQNYWVFSVRDNGIGIHERYLGRIFLVFQRLHTTQKYPGTGIGLSICKRIVENHGGTIWAESRLGEGSTFYFSLPSSKAPTTVDWRNQCLGGINH